jgi:hypothetical protein
MALALPPNLGLKTPALGLPPLLSFLARVKTAVLTPSRSLAVPHLTHVASSPFVREQPLLCGLQHQQL